MGGLCGIKPAASSQIQQNTKNTKKNTKARYWHGPMWDQACCIFTDSTKYQKIQKNTKKYKKIQKQDIGMGLCGIKPAASSQIQQNTKKYKKYTKNTKKYKSKILAWAYVGSSLLHLHRFNKIQNNTRKIQKQDIGMGLFGIKPAASSQIQQNTN